MPKGLSLHIGVNRVDGNHYGGWEGPLNACEYDALDMQDLAEQKKFNSQILLTENATRDAVTSAISQAADELESGDIFFLSYSGHGGQVPDVNGDEPDREDETWCLFDAQLIDDELRILWSRFRKGVRILVFSDSCHSGTVTRSPENFAAASRANSQVVSSDGQLRFRRMPVDPCNKTYRTNKRFYDDIQRNIERTPPPLEATVRLISGCQDNQLSLDGSFNGLFTGQLLRAWSFGRFVGNYDQFHRAILETMPPTQSPNHFVVGPPNPLFDDQLPFSIS